MSINLIKNRNNSSPVTFFHACTGLAFPEKLLHERARQIYAREKIPAKKNASM